MEFVWKTLAVALLCCLATARAITDPLPDDRLEPMAVSMKCPNNKEFKWKKTDAVGKDIVIYYSCGDNGAELQKKLQCPNGKKANYRRNLIPRRMLRAARRLLLTTSKRQSIEYNPEPNFGLFSTSGNPNILNSATAVYACMKPVRR